MEILLAAIVASIAWFIIGGILYMNPVIGKIYKGYASHKSMKKWESQKKYMINMYLVGSLIPSILFALVYSFLSPLFTDGLIMNAFYFWIILVAIKLIPRFFDMWIQTSYPNKLLYIELINGSIGSFVMAVIFAWII
jgi:hypothetical protein